MPVYANDWIDGREVPPLIIRGDFVLREKQHQGSIHVESGKLIIDGTHQGSLHIHAGASAEIVGQLQGSLHLERGCDLTIYGISQGSATLERGSILVIENGGRLAGSLSNNGKVILRGVFGGSRSGDGEFIVDGGTIKQPVVNNGANYYEW